MIVFNVVEEFLAELEKDKDLAERKIIRLTNAYQQNPSASVPCYLFVVAAYKVKSEIVQFKQYVGELWNMERDNTVIQQSTKIQEKIEEACKRYGLEVRAGIYTKQGKEAEQWHSVK